MAKPNDPQPQKEIIPAKRTLALHQVLSTELGRKITPQNLEGLSDKTRKIIRQLLARLKTEKARRLKAEELADTDVLTNLPNKRATEQELKEMCERRSTNHPRRKKGMYPAATVVEFDLNDFKVDVNDPYGDTVGDELLRHVAQFVRRKLYDTDFLGRLGGDEFVVIMRETTEQKAREKMERILEELKETPLMTDYKNQATDIHTSASYGATQMREGDTVDAIRDRLHREIKQYKAERLNSGSTPSIESLLARIDRELEEGGHGRG